MKLSIVAPVVMALLLPTSALAADEARIAFVDSRKAILASREGKSAQQEISRKEEMKLDKLRPMQDELKRLEEELEKQRYLITDDALAERQFEIIKRRRDLERDVRAADDDLQIDRMKLLQPIQKKLSSIVEALGKEKGFTLIIDRNTPGVLFSDGSLDVTEIVIQRLNDK